MTDLNETISDTNDVFTIIADYMSIKFVISITISYLLFVYVIGPSWMKNKTPYRLKNFMSFYNVIQVVTCLYIINLIFDLESWDLFNLKKCIRHEPGTPAYKEFKNILCKSTLLKIMEYADTVVFVMRKKQNQISYLHVFHHSCTVTLAFICLKYVDEHIVLLPIYINSWVHVIMYTYYFFANIYSAEVMKKFILIKKSITIIQMIQFCIVLFQAGFTWTLCQVPLLFKVYYCIVVMVIFYGFYDFYKKAYTNKPTNELKSKAK